VPGAAGVPNRPKRNGAGSTGGVAPVMSAAIVSPTAGEAVAAQPGGDPETAERRLVEMGTSRG
jgi:hypothetical protein